MYRNSRGLLLFATVIIFVAVSVFLILRDAQEPSNGNSNGEGRTQTLVARTDFFMDTRVTVSIPEDQQHLLGETLVAMRRASNQFDRYLSESEVYQMNQHNGEWQKISEELFFLLQTSLAMGKELDGAFDPTVGPLIDAWGFPSDTQRVPPQEEIDALLELVGLDRIAIRTDSAGPMVRLAPGTTIDLGGAAKGYVIDVGVTFLAEQGVTNAIVDGGGDLYTIGRRPDGKQWRIGVRDPKRPDQVAAVIAVEDAAVASSGGYFRKFTWEGEEYHHILDPKTGKPAAGSLSITVVAPTVLEADILTTAFFVLGIEPSLQYAEQHLHIEALIVDENGVIHISSGLERVEDGGSVPTFRKATNGGVPNAQN